MRIVPRVLHFSAFIILCMYFTILPYYVECNSFFKLHFSGVASDNIHPKVTALVATGKNVLVGTDFGTVGIIDSETCEVLHCLKWHNTKVRTLLLMPKEMEPCVCSELPLAESNQQNSITRLLNRPSTHKLLRQRTISDSELPSLTESSESVLNSELEKYTCMVASIGNGRAGIVETNLSKKDDVCMLLWRC